MIDFRILRIGRDFNSLEFEGIGFPRNGSNTVDFDAVGRLPFGFETNGIWPTVKECLTVDYVVGPTLPQRRKNRTLQNARSVQSEGVTIA